MEAFHSSRTLHSIKTILSLFISIVFRFIIIFCYFRYISKAYCCENLKLIFSVYQLSTHNCLLKWYLPKCPTRFLLSLNVYAGYRHTHKAKRVTGNRYRVGHLTIIRTPHLLTYMYEPTIWF